MLADAPTPPAFVCVVTNLHDGDNIYCRGKAHRLENVDAPEWENSPRCRKARPGVVCDDAAALRSTVALGAILASGPVLCQRVGTDPYRRPLVRCRVNGRDVGASLIAGGFAVAWRGR